MPAAMSPVESILQYRFRDSALLEEALIHPSAGRSYQRLEFLGDAVLGLAVAHHIYHTEPDANPGDLSPLRAANVSTEKLARVAVRHRLYDHLRRNAPDLDALVKVFTAAVDAEHAEDAVLAALYGGGTVSSPKVLADMVEALAGAVYMDMNCGLDLEEFWGVFQRVLEPIITFDTFYHHPVSTLTVLCQKKHWKLEFSDTSRGDGQVTIEVLVNGQLLGSGSSVQNHTIAKLNAAKEALPMLRATLAAIEELEAEGGGGANKRLVLAAIAGREQEEGGAKKKEGSNSKAIVSAAAAPVLSCGPEDVQGAKNKLHILCHKKQWQLPVYRLEDEKGPTHNRRFTCSVELETSDGVLFRYGDPMSKVKVAENAAAFNILKDLIDSTP